MSIHMLTVAVIVISFVLYGCCCVCVCVCVCASVDEAMSFCGFVSVVALTFDETKVTFVQKLTTLYCIPYFFCCILYFAFGAQFQKERRTNGKFYTRSIQTYIHIYLHTYVWLGLGL